MIEENLKTHIKLSASAMALLQGGAGNRTAVALEKVDVKNISASSFTEKKEQSFQANQQLKTS